MKKKVIIPYKHNLVEKAQQLRNNATFSERLLWKHLKRKQIAGYDFDRQKPIDKYIVDFFCNELMLVIEVDGITHNDKMNYDLKRQNDLERFGLTILRFNALDLVQNTQGVLEEIYCWVNENRKPTPDPSQEGKEGEEKSKRT
jgi:very-short-patch-repair endonuclease